MMKLEIIRHLDKLGRICIPIDFRKSLGVTEQSELLVTVTEEGILLKKKDAQDRFCDCRSSTTFPVLKAD